MDDHHILGIERSSLGEASPTRPQKGSPSTELPDPKGQGRSRKLWAWQTALVQRSPQRDAEHLYWFVGLCQALGLDDDGTGAASALGAVATAFQTLARLLAWQALSEVGTWLDGMAADARSLAAFPSLTTTADAKRHKSVYLISGINPKSESQKIQRTGALAALAVVVLDAIRHDRSADHHTIQRCKSMASHCSSASSRAGSHIWQHLAKLAPFHDPKLREFIAKCAEDEPLKLAKRLYQAMQFQERPTLPGNHQRRSGNDGARATFEPAETPRPELGPDLAPESRSS